MADLSSLSFSSGRRLSQTRLSSYFSCCAKMPPPVEKTPKKKKRVRSNHISISNETFNTNKPNVLEDIIAAIPKRKLPVPIFSDDEGSENEEPVSKSPKRSVVNKTPSTCVTPPSTSGVSTPSSTPTTKKKNTKSPIKIRLLEHTVNSSLNEPNVEKKKINYEQLKVMQEFYENIKESYLASLLTNEEKELLSKFFSADKNYQYVCVKLFIWKPIWYNIFSFVARIELPLDNAEVTAMYNFFKENDFAQTDYSDENLNTLLQNLVLKDLRDIARTFKIPNNGPKDTIIEKLVSTSKRQGALFSFTTGEALMKCVKEKMGFCVKLSENLMTALHHVYVLNTFTNSNLTSPQDYFTNVKYFNMVFPPFEIEDYQIFSSPSDFSQFAEVVKLRGHLHKAIEKRNAAEIFEVCGDAFTALKLLNEKFGDTFSTSKPPHLERFSPNAQCVSVLTTGLNHLTTAYYDRIVEWYEYLLSQKYCSYRRGDWYAHLILIYTTHLKKYEDAAKLVIKAFNEEKDNLSDFQLHELAHRGKMLNRKSYKVSALYRDEIAFLSPPSCERDWPQDVVDSKSVKSDDSRGRRMYAHHRENGDVDYLTVEQTALEYYKSVDFPKGVHCEGGLIVATMSLLFWDIIYDSKVEATFVSNVQNFPLDMNTKYFYKNREHRILKRLENIKQNWTDAKLKDVIANNWVHHSHESGLCLLESVVEGPDYLFDVLMCIGRPILTKILERLVRNYRLYHSGFPDLIVWNSENKTAKFVEVKSENDKLSLKQKLWLNYLIDINADIAVCLVEPKLSKKKLKEVKTQSNASR